MVRHKLTKSDDHRQQQRRPEGELTEENHHLVDKVDRLE